MRSLHALRLVEMTGGGSLVEMTGGGSLVEMTGGGGLVEMTIRRDLDEVGDDHWRGGEGGGAPGEADAEATGNQTGGACAELLWQLRDHRQGNRGRRGVTEMVHTRRELFRGQLQTTDDHIVHLQIGLMQHIVVGLPIIKTEMRCQLLDGGRRRHDTK